MPSNGETRKTPNDEKNYRETEEGTRVDECPEFSSKESYDANGNTFNARESEMSMDLDLDCFEQDLGFFAGFGLDLDLRFWQVSDLDLD